jgi:hypothetical protein
MVLFVGIDSSEEEMANGVNGIGAGIDERKGRDGCLKGLHARKNEKA